jgi:hypothetical protein
MEKRFCENQTKDNFPVLAVQTSAMGSIPMQFLYANYAKKSANKSGRYLLIQYYISEIDILLLMTINVPLILR